MEKSKQQKKKSGQEIVKQVLEEAGLTPVPLDDAPGFAFGFKDDSPPVAGLALIYDDDRRFIIYLEFRERVDSERRPKVVEFITRANFGMTFGNFEMDYETGLIRFKTSIDYTRSQLRALQVKNAILGAMEGVEVYADQLLSVVEGKKSPKKAILDAESVL